uniref:Uncharacterized protein n=2 Tax=Ditylenchus dipsaci TaxID=166011 RepID=A0A915CS09_9BILA
MPLLAHLGHQLFKSSHPPEVEGPDVLEKWALFESGGGFFGLFGGSKDKSKLITYKGKKTSKFIEFFEKDEKRLAYVHSHSKYVVEVRKETQKSLVQLKLASCEGQAVLAVRIKNSGTEMKCKINMQKVEKSGRRLFEFTGRSKSAKESSGGAEVEHYYFTLDSVDNKKETKDQKNLTDYKHSYQLEVGMPATKLGGSTIDFAYKYKFDLDLTNPFGMIINDPKEKSSCDKIYFHSENRFSTKECQMKRLFSLLKRSSEHSSMLEKRDKHLTHLLKRRYNESWLSSKNLKSFLEEDVEAASMAAHSPGLMRNAVRQSYLKWVNGRIPYTISKQYTSYGRDKSQMPSLSTPNAPASNSPQRSNGHRLCAHTAR